MSEVYTVWWIDDELDSHNASEVLNEQSDRIEVEDFPPETALDRVGLRDGESEDIDEDADQGSVPDLILIDWKLNRRSDFSGRGTSMLGIVRDRFGKIPIYGFSADPEDMNADQFLRVFDLNTELTTPGTADDLVSDIEDFKLINEKSDEGLEGLISTLNPPKGQEGDLRPIIPRELSQGLSNHPDGEITGLHQFTDWVLKRFLQRPGLLLDDLWTATKLGLTEEAFAGRKQELRDAVDGQMNYSGVLRPPDDRWWRSQVIQALINIDESEGGDGRFDRTWKKGVELFADSKQDVAECAVCEDPQPHTVAAPSPNSNEREPVHYECSEVHHTREGAFADFRIFYKED